MPWELEGESGPVSWQGLPYRPRCDLAGWQGQPGGALPWYRPAPVHRVGALGKVEPRPPVTPASGGQCGRGVVVATRAS